MTPHQQRLALAERRSVWVNTVPRVTLASGPTAADRKAAFWALMAELVTVAAVLTCMLGLVALVTLIGLVMEGVL